VLRAEPMVQKNEAHYTKMASEIEVVARMCELETEKQAGILQNLW